MCYNENFCQWKLKLITIKTASKLGDNVYYTYKNNRMNQQHFCFYNHRISYGVIQLFSYLFNFIRMLYGQQNV